MARIRLDQVLVVDIEATCWEGSSPPGQENEIIEVGLCVLEVATGLRTQRRSILVKPTRSRVSAFCTQLTTLTQEQVDSGVSFAEACAILERDYAAKERVWASYGDYDRTLFKQQCQAMGVTYPFSRRHMNIKTLFALMHALPREIGMAAALSMLKMPLEGVHHRGDDDAWNIAVIFASLLKQNES